MIIPKFKQRLPLETGYLYCYLLNAPLFAIYGLMAFILFKDLHASTFQITILVAIKPIVAVFSSYWNQYYQGRIKGNIIGATFLGLFPTFFFPFFTNSWFLVISFAVYFFAERAVIPAWMELIKISFPASRQSKVVAQGSLIMFVASASFPLLVCPFLDQYRHSWKWIFPLLGSLSLLRLPILFSILDLSTKIKREKSRESHSILAPWKSAWALLKERPDFARYQLIFFCGGLGLMVMQPSLPLIIENNLHFSYTEIAVAVALCKGIGFALTTPIWSSRLHRTNIFRYCGIVTLTAAFSIALILCSSYVSWSIYVAFIFYGVMQAGSQLSWQLGGPIFSPNQDSSSYTSVNVILVGVRGCVGPAFGGLLCAQLGASIALIIGVLLCLSGFYLGYRRRESQAMNV